MKFCQTYDLKKINSFFLVRSNINGSRLLVFSFNRGGFLASNLNIHLNFTVALVCLCTVCVLGLLYVFAL